MKVIYISTQYKQWGNYSGFHQFVNYISRIANVEKFLIARDGNKLSRSRLHQIILFRLNNLLRTFTARNGSDWYGIYDFINEIRVCLLLFNRDQIIVHYLFAEHGLHFAPYLVRRFGIKRVKFVATFHQPPHLLEQLVNKDSLYNLDYITLVSPTQFDFFAQCFPSSKTKLVLHGIDTSFFSPPEKHHGTKEFRCLTVGHWLRDWPAIGSVAEKLRNRTDIIFHIVNGEILPFKSNDNIVQHTNLSDNELLDLYQQSDVLLLPITDATANNALLEGLACGLPAISTDHAAISAYAPKDSAYHIKNNDSDAIVSAILTLKSTPNKLFEMSKNARKQAEILNWESVSNSYLDVYRSTLENI